MSTFEHIIRQAHRRQLAALAIRRAGWGVCIAFAGALALLVIDRITNLQLSPLIFAALVAAGFIGGWLQALATRPDRLAIAVQLDRALRLKDRLGSAQAVRDLRNAAAHHDPDFATLVQRDAQKIADSIDVRSVTPIHISGIWGSAASLAFVLAAGIMFLPSIDWTSDQPRAGQTSLQNTQIQQQAREMTNVINQAVADLPKQQSLDPKAQEDLAALSRLAQQLSEKSASPDQVESTRDESAARLDELSEKLAEQSQRDLAASDELAKRFSGIDQTGAPKPPLSAKEFSEALKRGDFGAAAEKLDELLKGTSIPEDDRRAAAEHLRDLAKRIDQDAQKPAEPQTAEELREQLSQALRDQGLDQKTVDDLMEHPPQSPDEIANDLQRHNVDEDVARDLARDIDRLRKQNDVDEQVKQDTRDVSKALDRAADEVENPPPPPDQQPPATSEPDHQQQSEPPTSQPQQSQPDTPQRDQAQRDQTQKQQDGRQASDKSNSGKDQSSSQKQPSDSSQQQSQKQGERQSTQPDRAASSQNRDRPQEQGAPQQEQSGASTKPQGQSTQNRDRPRNEGAAEQQQSGASTKPDGQSPQNRDRPRNDGAAQSQPSNQQSSNQSTDRTDRSAGDKQQQQQTKPSGENSSQQRTGEGQPNPQTGDQPSPKSAERSDQPQSAPREEPKTSGDRPRNEGAEQQQQSGDPNSANQQRQQQQQQGQSARQKDDQSSQQSPSDVLRRLAERRGNAEDRQQSAEKLRELAKQFMQNTTPEQRKQWAEQWLKENANRPSQQDQQDTRQAQKNPEQNPDQNPANETPSEDQQKLAKELEDIAHELAKDMSPQERREWMDRAEKLKREQADKQPGQPMMADADSKDDSSQPPSGAGPGSRTGHGQPNQPDDSPQRLAQDGSGDEVDLRGRETADRIIAQWLSEQNNPAPPGASQRSASEAPESIRHAQDVAQRAVNDSAVQKRYHNTIKRYFGRLNETIRKAAGGDAAPAPAPGPETPGTPPAPPPDLGKSP